MKQIGDLVDNYTADNDNDSVFPLHFTICNARQTLYDAMQRRVGQVAWLDGYDAIADWMSDNERRGLLLIGGCGVGKSIIATQIVPLITKSLYDKVMHIHSGRDLSDSTHRDHICDYPLKVLDDVGTETEMSDYGVRRYMLTDIVDAAERARHFLVLTTNLSADDMLRRYGERTFDRLRTLCRVITIRGGSQRK